MYSTRLGIFAHVGQCFLGRAVGNELDICRHVDEGRRMQPRGNTRAALKVLCQPLHPGHQPLIEHGWTQVHHDALAGPQRVLQHLQRGARMALDASICGISLDPGQIKLDGGQ